jgi:hypothetical protein
MTNVTDGGLRVSGSMQINKRRIIDLRAPGLLKGGSIWSVDEPETTTICSRRQ